MATLIVCITLHLERGLICGFRAHLIFDKMSYFRQLNWKLTEICWYTDQNFQHNTFFFIFFCQVDLIWSFVQYFFWYYENTLESYWFCIFGFKEAACSTWINTCWNLNIQLILSRINWPILNFFTQYKAMIMGILNIDWHCPDSTPNHATITSKSTWKSHWSIYSTQNV